MAISFKEKRELQKIIADKKQELSKPGITFKEKRAAQKEMAAAFTRLKVTIKASPEKAAENEKLKKLIAGEFNKLEPAEFLKILNEIVEEINSIEPIKEPTISYIDANQDKLEAVTESAIRAALS